MSSYLGDFRLGKVVRKMWNSNAVAGESITRATNGTISVYKNGDVTQTTTGVTDTEDFDSLTGVHLVAIDTGTDATFYTAGADYEVVLSAATIDGKTINATLFSFSIENRSVPVDLLRSFLEFGYDAALGRVRSDVQSYRGDKKFMPVDAHKQDWSASGATETIENPGGELPTYTKTLSSAPADPITGSQT